MPSTTLMRLAVIAFALILVTALASAWRSVRRERLQLQQQLAETQHALTDAAARQRTRDAALASTLAVIDRQRASVRTPRQVVQKLPEVLPLPVPIQWPLPPPVPTEPENPPYKDQSPAPPLRLPSEDLKPLYDFALGCQGCQARLRTAQADLLDEQTKTEALRRERDSALRAARGGSALQRVARAAKWFLIGAAAGALAASAHR